MYMTESAEATDGTGGGVTAVCSEALHLVFTLHCKTTTFKSQKIHTHTANEQNESPYTLLYSKQVPVHLHNNCKYPVKKLYRHLVCEDFLAAAPSVWRLMPRPAYIQGSSAQSLDNSG